MIFPDPTAPKPKLANQRTAFRSLPESSEEDIREQFHAQRKKVPDVFVDSFQKAVQIYWHLRSERRFIDHGPVIDPSKGSRNIVRYATLPPSLAHGGYRAYEAVLKITGDRMNPKENGTLWLWQKHGLPSARVIEEWSECLSVRDLQGSYIATEFLSGPTLGNYAVCNSTEERIERIRMMALFMKQFYEIRLDSFTMAVRSKAPWDKRLSRVLNRALSQFDAKLLSCLPRGWEENFIELAASGKKLLHGDVNDANLIVERSPEYSRNFAGINYKSLRLIDPIQPNGNLLIGHAEADMAHMCAASTESIDEFTEGLETITARHAYDERFMLAYGAVSAIVYTLAGKFAPEKTIELAAEMMIDSGLSNRRIFGLGSFGQITEL